MRHSAAHLGLCEHGTLTRLLTDRSTTSRANRLRRQRTTLKSRWASLPTRPCLRNWTSTRCSTSFTIARERICSECLVGGLAGPPSWPRLVSESVLEELTRHALAQISRRVRTQEAILAVPQAVLDLVPARQRAATDYGRIRAGRVSVL